MKIGDVVRLKSGSPRMTVVWASKKRVEVAWFDMSTCPAQQGRAVFGIEAVEHYDPQPSPIKAVA